MLLPALLTLGISILTPSPDNPTRIVAEATGAPEGSTISLHLVDEETGEMGAAIFARSDRTKSGLRLTPNFALSRGALYRAVVRPPEGRPFSAEHRIPADRERGTAPTLKSVFPTADPVPANLLKFYLYFSEPMREGREVFDQIHIETEDGKRVHDPWRRRELWTDDARRLTLWIHPGRIKRGVNLREELGPVLQPNRKYTLVIDATLRSARGMPAGKEIRHSFTTSAEDHERPMPETWEVVAPNAGTREPLKVKSPEPLDHVLVERHLKVLNAKGEPVPMEFELAARESAWSIRPEKKWQAGEYRLVIGEFLEDLAGNTRIRVFDTDLSEPEPVPGAGVLVFRPKS